jgi:hypothetical protein
LFEVDPAIAPNTGGASVSSPHHVPTQSKAAAARSPRDPVGDDPWRVDVPHEPRDQALNALGTHSGGAYPLAARGRRSFTGSRGRVLARADTVIRRVTHADVRKLRAVEPTMTKRQPMTERSQQSHRGVSHRSAVERLRDVQSFAVDLPVLGRVQIPRPDQLAYYALAGLAALEIIDWPIALVIGAGHVLAENRHNKVAQQLGEALEQA